MGKVYGCMAGTIKGLGLCDSLLYIEKEDQELALLISSPYIEYKIIPKYLLAEIHNNILNSELEGIEVDEKIIDPIFEEAKGGQSSLLSKKASQLWKLVNSNQRLKNAKTKT